MKSLKLCRRLIFVRILLFKQNRFLHCWFLIIILLCYFYNTDSCSQLFSTSSTDLRHFSCRATKKINYSDSLIQEFRRKLLDPHVWDAKSALHLSKNKVEVRVKSLALKAEVLLPRTTAAFYGAPQREESGCGQLTDRARVPRHSAHAHDHDNYEWACPRCAALRGVVETCDHCTSSMIALPIRCV